MTKQSSQGALLLANLPQQSPEYWQALLERHSLTGEKLAPMLGRTGSDQALRNAVSRVTTGKHPLSATEHALLLLQLGEHPHFRLEPLQLSENGNSTPK